MKYFSNYPLNDEELKAEGYTPIGRPGLAHIPSSDVLRYPKEEEDYAKKAIALANGKNFEYDSFISFYKEDGTDTERFKMVGCDDKTKGLSFLIIQPLKKINLSK